MTEEIPSIDVYSMRSVKLVAFFGELELGVATGFCVENYGRNYLCTNWHVVSGRDPDTGNCIDKNLAIPDRLKIQFHSRNFVGQTATADIKLYNEDGEHVWIEHPDGGRVDVVLIPFDFDMVMPYPQELDSRKEFSMRPGAIVHVVGFPLGLTNNGWLPIWKTGNIASDVDLDFEEGRPAFLIDATTRGGMSGSPVYARSFGVLPRSDGAADIHSGVFTEFLGVYSGRQHKESEVGRVWRPSVLKDILMSDLRKDV